MNLLATLSTRDVSRITGLSMRQLDHWSRRGVIGPGRTGSGHARRWATEDVPALKVLAAIGAWNEPGLSAMPTALLLGVLRCYRAAGEPLAGFIACRPGGGAAYVETSADLAAHLWAHPCCVVVDVAVAVAAPAEMPAEPGPSAVGAATGAANSPTAA